MVYAICLFVALITAFGGSLLGLGGGILFVPLMLVFYQQMDGFQWATPQSIVGISLIAMIFTTFSSTLSNWRRGLVDVKLGLYLISGSIPGGMIGSWLNRFIQVDNFSLYFGSLLILISILFFINPKSKEADLTHRKGQLRTFQIKGITYQYKIAPLLPFLIALCVGTLSGLFGIGGGSIIVPTMIMLFGVPAHIAIATALFMIIFSSSVGSITHIALGHIPWSYVLYVLPGAILGGWLGAVVNQSLKGRTLIRILQICLIIIGIYLIVDTLI